MRADLVGAGGPALEALSLGRKFVVKTYHYSLKFLLDQRLVTIPQQWVSKLLGFDFIVEYKLGKQNVVADALLHRGDEAGQLLARFAQHIKMTQLWSLWQSILRGTN